MKNDFLKIKDLITKIQMEIMPLKNKYNILINQLNTNNSPINFKNQKNIEIHNESINLNKNLFKIKEKISKDNLILLKKIENEQKNLLLQIKTSNDELDHNIFNLQSQIDTIKLSKLFENIQNQNKTLKNLNLELNDLNLNNNSLKNEYNLLFDLSSTNNFDSSLNINKLNRKLDILKKTYSDKCEELIQLKNNQLKEIKKLTILLDN